MTTFSRENTVCNLIKKTEINKEIWCLRFENKKIADEVRAGQFVNVLVSSIDSTDPLLRRPISISSANSEEGWFEIIFRIVGRGTDMLSRLAIHSKVDILGPLGEGFSDKGESPLLVGGGMGVAPLILQNQKLTNQKVVVAIGGRGAGEVFWQQYFNKKNNEILVATDDGSVGRRGSIVDALEGLENKVDYIYTCGPNGLMKAVAEWARKHNISCEVSLEKYMACGVGVCLACSCSTTKGRKKICQNGPVFLAEEVCWDE